MCKDNTLNDKVAVKVSGIRKVYPIGMSSHKVAVNDVSFNVNKGECFGLLGINGAGKTTTFRMLTGDVNPTAGEIKINGLSIPKDMDEAR